MTNVKLGDIVEPWELSTTNAGIVLMDSVTKTPRVLADLEKNDDYVFTDRQGWENGTKFTVVYVPETEPEADPGQDLANGLKSAWFGTEATVYGTGDNWYRVADYVRENFVEKGVVVDYPLTIVDEEGDTWSRVPQNIDMYYYIDGDASDVVHESREEIRKQYGIRREF